MISLCCLCAAAAAVDAADEYYLMAYTSSAQLGFVLALCLCSIIFFFIGIGFLCSIILFDIFRERSLIRKIQTICFCHYPSKISGFCYGVH